MNTFFSVIVLLAFMALFVYLMYKIVVANTASSSSDIASSPPFNDTPTAAQIAEFASLLSAQGTGVVAMTKSVESMHLRDVVIKASYNSAFTGHYVNLDMVKMVLSRGCRVLDFQVFVKNGAMVVGYSNTTYDPSFTSMTSQNCVSLAGVCSTIMANAFSDTAPNKSDPLFVQFHLKTSNTNYDLIANVLYNNFKERLHWNASSDRAQEVSQDTRLGDLMGKIVVLTDAPMLSTYKTTCVTDCKSLQTVTNMMTGTTTVPLYTEQQLLLQMFAPMSTTPYLFRVVQPTLGFYGGITNPDASYLIMNYAAQVVQEAFYVIDSNLKTYESLFQRKKSAFLSLSDTIGYIKQKTP